MNAIPDRRRQGGFTLIELALVVGVVSLFMLAALAGYQHVVEEGSQHKLISEIAAIRKAVDAYAAGGLLYYDGAGTCSDAAHFDKSACTGAGETWTDGPDLEDWAQIKRRLPHPLREKAAAGSAVLANANPYGGDYVFVPATAAAPRRWKLRATGLPPGMGDAFVKGWNTEVLPDDAGTFDPAAFTVSGNSGTLTLTFED